MGHCRRTALHCALHKMLLRARLVLVRSVSSVKRGITPTGKQRWSSPGSHNSRHPTQRQLQNQKLKGETATRSSGSDNQTPKVAAVTCPSSEQHHQLHQNPQATKGAAPPAKRSAPSSIQDISDMRLVFLGTSSSEPTRTRNVPSLALRMGGKTWLFDCGEGTQRQICSTGAFTTPTIERIFMQYCAQSGPWHTAPSHRHLRPAGAAQFHPRSSEAHDSHGARLHGAGTAKHACHCDTCRRLVA